MQARVTVLEASDRLGGNIRTSLARGLDHRRNLFRSRPRARSSRAVPALGLGGDLVSPAIGSAYVWARGELRLPPGLVLGVPAELLPVARSGILSTGGTGCPRATAARRPVPSGALGPMVSNRFGREVLERLVDPLISGINAGDSERLSASAVTPQIDSAARRSRSLLLGAAPIAERTLLIPARRSSSRCAAASDAWSTDSSMRFPRTPHRSRFHSTAAGVEVDSAGVTVLADTSAGNPRRISANGAVIACPAGAAASALADLARRWPPPSARSTRLGRPRHPRLRRRGHWPRPRCQRPARSRSPSRRPSRPVRGRRANGATGESLIRRSSGPRRAAMASDHPAGSRRHRPRRGRARGPPKAHGGPG